MIFSSQTPLSSISKKANGTSLNEATGETWPVAEQEDVERIAILGNRLRYKAVVSGIVDWRKKVPVKDKDLEIQIVLQLARAVLWDFDYRTDDFGCTITDGKFQVAVHFAPSQVRTQEQNKNPCFSAGVIIQPVSGGI